MRGNREELQTIIAAQWKGNASPVRSAVQQTRASGAAILVRLLVGLVVFFWIFHLAQDIKRTGFWSMMHEARADLTMLLGSLYLLIRGGGRWSLDAHLTAPSSASESRILQHSAQRGS